MKSFDSKAKPIREFMNMPEVSPIASHLTNVVHGFHRTAPNVAQSVQAVGMRALNFLHSKLPKASTELIGDEDFEAPVSDQRHWLDLHDLVESPTKALDHVRHGTLTSAHMEALNEVHPELLNEMREKVMEQMEPKKVKSLPTSTKMALQLFLGTPVASSLLPGAIQANQAVLQQKVLTNDRLMGPKSTLGGLKSLDLGKRASTETQDLEEET